jgi:hypothetical protein
MESQVEVLLATVDEDTPVTIQSCDVSKEIQSLKLQKACSYDALQINVSGSHFLNRRLLLGHFPAFWKETEFTAAETRQSSKISQNIVRPASCPLRANYLRN